MERRPGEEQEQNEEQAGALFQAIPPSSTSRFVIFQNLNEAAGMRPIRHPLLLFARVRDGNSSRPTNSQKSAVRFVTGGNEETSRNQCRSPDTLPAMQGYRFAVAK